MKKPMDFCDASSRRACELPLPCRAVVISQCRSSTSEGASRDSLCICVHLYVCRGSCATGAQRGMLRLFTGPSIKADLPASGILLMAPNALSEHDLYTLMGMELASMTAGHHRVLLRSVALCRNAHLERIHCKTLNQVQFPQRSCPQLFLSLGNIKTASRERVDSTIIFYIYISVFLVAVEDK